MDWFPFDGHGFGGVCIRNTGLENLHHGDWSPRNSTRFWLVVSKNKVSTADDDNDFGPHLNLKKSYGSPNDKNSCSKLQCLRKANP